MLSAYRDQTHTVHAYLSCWAQQLKKHKVQVVSVSRSSIYVQYVKKTGQQTFTQELDKANNNTAPVISDRYISLQATHSSAEPVFLQCVQMEQYQASSHQSKEIMAKVNLRNQLHHISVDSNALLSL